MEVTLQSNGLGSLNTSYTSTDALIIQHLADEPTTDGSVSISSTSLDGALTITAREILDKLNELLKESLPDGIEGLAPEQSSSETVATRVVQGITAFYDLYAKQHPELSDEELVDSFIEEALRGVNQGYDEAFEILEGLGAFKFDGVQKGVEDTKSLIVSKLEAFGNFKREELGLNKESEKAPNTES